MKVATLILDDDVEILIKEKHVLVWNDCNGNDHREQFHNVMAMLDSAEEIEFRVIESAITLLKGMHEKEK